ncbi:hypothetical protein H6F74_28320 [Trichocoleus sp. FACHB-90]|uniref:hypothetical protein n=1 Tax=Cyanophyceae TaxID=3028117 RepID=UPI0016846C50|nr:hypothetical protein [Trichocoleus sp. FACHB-90]MBD1930097.1 hypothetical protein [Trichocoleus sp. FACHB-90]
MALISLAKFNRRKTLKQRSINALSAALHEMQVSCNWGGTAMNAIALVSSSPSPHGLGSIFCASTT